MKLPSLHLPNSLTRHSFLVLAFVLSLAGYVTAPLVQAQELQPIPNKLVVLTFDDGNKSDRSFVAEILKKHGFGATFYITEGLGFLQNKDNYVSWPEIRELHVGF